MGLPALPDSAGLWDIAPVVFVGGAPPIPLFKILRPGTQLGVTFTGPPYDGQSPIVIEDEYGSGIQNWFLELHPEWYLD